MNSKHSSAFLFFLLLFALPRSSRSDYSPPECPYPCLPPPTMGANYPPPPPSEPTWGGYPPPPGTPSYDGYYPPPSGGYLPYYSPPDYALPAPPPPNPIVPWFPFYRRGPSLPPSSASAAAARSGAIFATLLTVFLSILLA